MGDRDTAWVIEDLNSGRDRTAFNCGRESLDTFLKRYASQNQKAGVCRTYIALRPNESIVLGYHSISAGAVAFDDLPEAQRKRLPKYPVPVAHLGRLAVDRSVQGCGLGEFLLMDAFMRITAAADTIGIHAIEVVAIDESARRFYRRYGFVELLDDAHHLYISMKTIRKLGLV